ncbi:hypothetical protein LP420_04090 [Massilia sp. B-10]|nr:hypothetical protein LP420_04090 [Massilia sp. B-10]
MSVTTGGSSTQKMDEASYRLMSMANYRTSVTSVFSQVWLQGVRSRLRPVRRRHEIGQCRLRQRQ